MAYDSLLNEYLLVNHYVTAQDKLLLRCDRNNIEGNHHKAYLTKYSCISFFYLQNSMEERGGSLVEC